MTHPKSPPYFFFQGEGSTVVTEFVSHASLGSCRNPTGESHNLYRRSCFSIQCIALRPWWGASTVPLCHSFSLCFLRIGTHQPSESEMLCIQTLSVQHDLKYFVNTLLKNTYPFILWLHTLCNMAAKSQISNMLGSVVDILKKNLRLMQSYTNNIYYCKCNFIMIFLIEKIMTSQPLCFSHSKFISSTSIYCYWRSILAYLSIRTAASWLTMADSHRNGMLIISFPEPFMLVLTYFIIRY